MIEQQRRKTLKNPCNSQNERKVAKVWSRVIQLHRQSRRNDGYVAANTSVTNEGATHDDLGLDLSDDNFKLPQRYRFRDLLLGDFAFNDDGERWELSETELVNKFHTIRENLRPARDWLLECIVLISHSFILQAIILSVWSLIRPLLLSLNSQQLRYGELNWKDENWEDGGELNKLETMENVTPA